MSLGYQDDQTRPSQAPDRVEVSRRQLFRTYIERVLKRKGTADKPYQDKQAVNWLSWLAQNLTVHNQVIFLIEGLQPSWLSNRRWRWAYLLGSRSIGGLSVGLICGLGGRLKEGLSLGLGSGLFLGQLAALWYGGLDVTQHYTLRLIMWYNSHIPLNYPRFLDYATDRIFLRKVGGGYIRLSRLGLGGPVCFRLHFKS